MLLPLTIILVIIAVGVVIGVYKTSNNQSYRDEGTKGFNYIEALIMRHREQQLQLSGAGSNHNFIYDVRITQFDAPFRIKDEGVYQFTAPHIKEQNVRDYLRTYCKRKEWTYRETKNDFEGIVIDINTYVSCAIC